MMRVLAEIELLPETQKGWVRSQVFGMTPDLWGPGAEAAMVTVFAAGTDNVKKNLAPEVGTETQAWDAGFNPGHPGEEPWFRP